MDYVNMLSKRLSEINKKIQESKNQVTVGAKKGVLNSQDSVDIGGQTYTAYLACDVPTPVKGIPVWCQLAGKNSAVVVGVCV